MVGASLEEVAEEEDEDDEAKLAGEASSKPKAGVYQIVGTLSQAGSTKPDFAEETYTVSGSRGRPGSGLAGAVRPRWMCQDFKV